MKTYFSYRNNGAFYFVFLPRMFLTLIHNFFLFALVGMLWLWHRGIGPFLGNHCRFYPTCSCYGALSLLRHGLFFGSFLTIKRVFRCHPWNIGGVDEVPLRKRPEIISRDYSVIYQKMKF